MNWKRADYLVHRWLSIVLGLVVLSWFVSGIVMIYYPWPALTSSTRLTFDEPFEPPAQLIGVGRAAAIAASTIARLEHRPQHAPLTSARLTALGTRYVYSFARDRGGVPEEVALVDAMTGTPLTPLDSSGAIVIARSVVSEPAPLRRVWLERHPDHYLMSGEYRRDFPDWVVRFDDPSATAVYVSAARGHITGVVTTRTRLTTWLGAVPHWLYFQWLYDWRNVWLWVNLVFPGIAVIAATAGLLLGVAQIFPLRRHDLTLRLSPYRGVSRWHHLGGVAFGLLVLTWSLSGVLQVLGPDSEPRPGQGERARGGSVQGNTFAIGEAAALKAARLSMGAIVRPHAIEATVSGSRAGYRFHFDDGRERWVDASTGAVRGELDTAAAAAIARSILPGAPIARMDRIASYDAYYYARPGRELRLPVWRVELADADHSVVYLDAVSGEPTGFVDDQFRHWRWMRDGLHSLDFPVINNKRPLWDVVLLFFMFGGTASAVTGVWLALRRMRRLSRSDTATPSLPPPAIRATLSTETATGSAP